MKTIPATLLTKLDKRGRSTCFLVKIVSEQDGQVFGFTSLDAPLTFDDGDGPLTYSPNNALTPKNIQATSDTDVDNTECSGWFSEAVRVAVDAGVLSGAVATIYRVSYTDLSAGAEVVMHGVVGTVKYETNPNSPREFEIRGLDHLLKTKRNPQYSITCRNTFGDSRCKMPFTWASGAVAEVVDNFLLFKLSGIAQPADYYNAGVIRFDTGSNAGAELEVEAWDGQYARLSFATPYPVVVGDTVSVRRDCDKFASTCINTYANIVNFNGEHLTPVQDQSLMVPGAYIKSNNAL